ncbi:MAG: 23S rRNA (adenine(2503)-C(2))-methyltransferase RlmN [Oscillospiraceae bacterium]|nr:23S rRNA (adenine(2503)-C(2))-methyltransferase RlmN [Oscillospiraceae bacterium]
MTDILSLTPEELKEEILALGLPAFRAKQISGWLKTGVRDFSEMSNLPKELRESLKERFSLTAPVLLRAQTSELDQTGKFLWGLSDGNCVETVLMRYRYGNSVCISSQVGCRQGCAFCASTIGGLIRPLTAGEMLDEVLFTEKENDVSVSNVVLMGIGEPLDNLDNVLRFLHLVSHPEGRNLSLRHITVSTCGLPEGIRRLSEEKLPITLSVSLHAPDDETRSRIMPSNCGIQRLAEVCEEYFARTGRRLSFEYAMIAGVNDSDRQAELLAGLARRLGAHVNLIPLNYVAERGLKPSSPAVIRRFQGLLEEKGVNVTVRRSLGGDIDASCGQLRRKHMNKQQ